MSYYDDDEFELGGYGGGLVQRGSDTLPRLGEILGRQIQGVRTVVELGQRISGRVAHRRNSRFHFDERLVHALDHDNNLLAKLPHDVLALCRQCLLVLYADISGRAHLSAQAFDDHTHAVRQLGQSGVQFFL